MPADEKSVMRGSDDESGEHRPLRSMTSTTHLLALLAGTALLPSTCLSGTVTLGNNATGGHGSGGGTTTQTTGSTSASGSGGSTACGVVAAGTYACSSDLATEGPCVLVGFEAGPPPTTGMGGTLVDGTYDLTATTIYQSSPTTQPYYARESLRISGAATLIEYVSAVDGPTSIAGTIAPSGPSLGSTTTCPAGGGQLIGPNYSATSNQVTIVNGLYTKVFTKRP
jgi:hypothetical protein